MTAIHRISGRLGAAIFAAGVVLAGCSDSPSGPAVRAAALELAVSADEQVALAGDAVPLAPAVVVKDSRGRPLSGITVAFSVIAGGGSLERARATTDSAGIASAGSWRLGTAPGPNEVEARVAALPAVRFVATALDPSTPPGARPGAFDITLRYVTTPTLRQQQAVEAAVARWRTVVVGDLPDIPLSSPAGSCSAAQPALNETVDDLLLLVEFVNIDGPGKTLGEAGPCYIRMGGTSSLPVAGYMKLDAQDLQHMETAGTLDDVVLHEMGHILGIGTLWTEAGLLTGAGTTDPQFTGAQAISAYRGMGGLDAGVPVENTGTTGTRDGHWRESVFGSELMTGWIGSRQNPLSGMTIASLQDLGYGASLIAAATYTLGSMTQSALMPIDLRGRERIHGPRFRVDKHGRKVGVSNPALD